MKKKEQTVWQHRFNLYSGDEVDRRIHEYLSGLADKGDASQFIRLALLEAVDKVQQLYSGTTTVPEYKGSTTLVQSEVPSTTVVLDLDKPLEFGTPVSDDSTTVVQESKPSDNGTRLVPEYNSSTGVVHPAGWLDPDEPGLIPDEKTRRRRANAKLRLDKPDPKKGGQ